MRPFESCRERIQRADAHNETLTNAWNSLIEHDPYRVVVQMQDDGTGAIFVRPNYTALPTLFSLELGEMLYQFRSALDCCIYDAAVLETGKNPPPDEQDLAFPICICSKAFKNARRNIAPLKKERREIVKAVQPYNAPTLAPELMVFNFNRAIGILHDWARKDRHRQLHMVGSWAFNANPMVRFPSGASLAYMNVTGGGFLENESQIASFKIDGYIPSMNVEGNPYLAIDIAVDEVPPRSADNDTFGNRMLAISNATKCIVGSFERSFGIKGVG